MFLIHTIIMYYVLLQENAGIFLQNFKHFMFIIDSYLY